VAPEAERELTKPTDGLADGLCATITATARARRLPRLTAEVQNLMKPRSVYRDPALVQRVATLMAKA
jgi:hypothetical protein